MSLYSYQWNCIRCKRLKRISPIYLKEFKLKRIKIFLSRRRDWEWNQDTAILINIEKRYASNCSDILPSSCRYGLLLRMSFSDINLFLLLEQFNWNKNFARNGKLQSVWFGSFSLSVWVNLLWYLILLPRTFLPKSNLSVVIIISLEILFLIY